MAVTQSEHGTTVRCEECGWAWMLPFVEGESSREFDAELVRRAGLRHTCAQGYAERFGQAHALIEMLIRDYDCGFGPAVRVDLALMRDFLAAEAGRVTA